MERCLIWCDRQPHSPHLNMALDEALLCGERCDTILRWYFWDRECVSFGYGQSFAVVKEEAPAPYYVRRWTGGGCVSHGGDMTFSIIFPKATGWSVLPPRQIYCEIHGAVADLAGQVLGISCHLAGEEEVRNGVSCFFSPSLADVISCDGQKLCGGAIRKTRWGMLYQGSLRMNGVEGDFFGRLADLLFGCREEWVPDGKIFEAAEQLAVEKYGTLGWLERIA